MMEQYLQALSDREEISEEVEELRQIIDVLLGGEDNE